MEQERVLSWGSGTWVYVKAGGSTKRVSSQEKSMRVRQGLAERLVGDKEKGKGKKRS